MIVEVGIICVSFLVAAYFYLHYKNPYEEEIIDKVDVYAGGDLPVKFVYHIKRTYKNGKVEIIKKQFDN